MECPNCQFKNSDGMNFCGKCGAKLEKICPSCQFLNPPEHAYCGKCGHSLRNANEPGPQDLSYDDKLSKIQRYLPEGIVDKILKQKDKIEGERKHVTVMFCDMEGFTALSEKIGTEEMYTLMDQIYELLIHKVHDFEGTVNEMTGDGIMALFGAPIALEDAPQRAIRASYAIHREMTKFSQHLSADKGLHPIKMRIGIHTGFVIVGTVGNNLRVEFKAVGDTVNLASRMEGLAEPGSTYVTGDVYKLTEGFFRFESLGKKRVKGMRESVEVYRVIAPSSRQTRFDVSAERGLTPFIARSREIEILLDAFERVKRKQGQAFSIMGEAGTGKSRILYEFRKAVANENITFLEGKCLSYTSGVAYLPVMEILKANFYIQEEDDNNDIERKVTQGIKDVGAEDTLTIPHLLEILTSGRDESHRQAIGPDAKKERIIEALRRIVLKASEIRPLVMAFEDLHWMDNSSEDALKDLLENISGSSVFLIFTYRPEFVHTWGAKSYHSQINLNKFSNRESLNMASLLLGAEEIDSGLQDLILEKTEGIPFFIEEFVKSLADQHMIAKRQGRHCFVKQQQDVMVPSTIQDVIMAKVDSLPDDARSILQTAAVAGREFRPDLIQAIWDLSDKQILSQLSLLKESELLYERGVYPQSYYLFKHALTQEVIYNSLLLKRRKRIHEVIGQTIEKLFPQRLDEFSEVLAYHYSNSASSEKAILYLELAGDKTARVHSLEEARQHYEDCLSILERKRDQLNLQQKYIELTLKWAETCQYRPNNKVSDTLLEALNTAQKIEAGDWQARVLYWISRFAYMQGDFTVTIPRIELCIEKATNLKDGALLAISYNLIGRSCLYTDEHIKGINYLNKGLDLIKPYGKLDEVVYSIGIKGLLQGLTGKLKESINTIESAIAIAKDNQIFTFEAMAFGYLGTIHFFYGNWGEAIEKCSSCIEISKRLGNLLPMAWASVFMGAAIYRSGKEVEGLHVMRNACTTVIETDSVLALRYFYSLYAEFLALHGDFDEAESINQKALGMEKFGQKWGKIISLRTMAMIEANKLNPDWTVIENLMTKSLRLAEDKYAFPELIAGHRCYANLLKTKGDMKKSTYHLEQVKLLAEKIEYKWNGRSPGHQA